MLSRQEDIFICLFSCLDTSIFYQENSNAYCFVAKKKQKIIKEQCLLPQAVSTQSYHNMGKDTNYIQEFEWLQT